MSGPSNTPAQGLNVQRLARAQSVEHQPRREAPLATILWTLVLAIGALAACGLISILVMPR